MAYIIAGLGNPGEEYEGTRHNTGIIVLDSIANTYKGDDFVFDKKINALKSEIKIRIAKSPMKIVSLRIRIVISITICIK